jgi:formylglycine-generating enzyme required for sulfatase activity
MMCESPALQHQRIRKSWRDADEMPLMIELPGGEFVMGENIGDKFANDTERPAHRVEIATNVALGKFPVTVGEFREFRPGHALADAEDLPVAQVSWQDALDYCDWLTRQTRREYRLPSESEWEFACRAGSRAPFAGGDEIAPEDANFLHDEQGLRIGIGCRTPVGNYPANAFGLHDFHGNVCEWVADAWHPNYFGAPNDGSAWVDVTNSRRVIRGGAWDYLPRLLRSSWRDWRPTEHRADNIGFRVATSDLKNSAAD